MHTRHLISRLIVTWRNLVSYFAWPEPRPTLKGRSLRRGGLALDLLEDRTTPTVLWGTPDFLISGSAFPVAEPFKHAETSQVRNLETHQAEVSRSAVYSATQVAQVDRLLDFSPAPKATWAPTPLPTRESVLPASDALFAQMSDEPTLISSNLAFPAMKHRATPHPAMIGAMALVGVPLVMANKSRDEETAQSDQPRKPFPRTIRL